MVVEEEPAAGLLARLDDLEQPSAVLDLAAADHQSAEGQRVGAILQAARAQLVDLLLQL